MIAAPSSCSVLVRQTSVSTSFVSYVSSSPAAFSRKPWPRSVNASLRSRTLLAAATVPFFPGPVGFFFEVGRLAFFGSSCPYSATRASIASCRSSMVVGVPSKCKPVTQR